MAACACSTGLFQLQVLPKTVATSSSASSQLKPERVTQAKEVQCAGLPSLTECVCESRDHCGANRTSVNNIFAKKSGKLNSLRLHGTGRTHARVQDTVENDTYDRLESASSPRGKERSRGWQSNHGNERRKVQVITDDGFVDLEEQLGISKNTKGRSRRGNSRRNGSSSRGFEEDEERLYLDGYELISVAEFDDSLNFGRNSFYSADELQIRQAAATPLEINKFLAEKGNSEERSNSSTSTFLDSPHPPLTDVQDYERVATRRIAADRGSKITEEADSIAKILERQMLMERIGNSENGSISSSSSSSSSSRYGTPIAVRMRRNVPAQLSKPLKSGEEPFLSSKCVRDARGSVTRNAAPVTTDVRETEDLEAVQFSHQDTVELDVKDELRNVRRQMSSGDTAGARKVLQKLLKRHPDDATVMVHMAQLQKKEGDTLAAGAYYEKAVAILKGKKDYGVDYVKTLQGWGSLEAQARNSSRARSLFQECVRVSEKAATGGAKELVEAGVYGLHGWAMLEQKLGYWSEARELLQRAADIQPGNAVVHQTRALLEAQAHNYASARHHFRLGVTAAPEDVKCWQAWALFEASQGKPGKMRQLFQKALEVEPNNLHSLQAWAHQEALLDTESSRSRARNLYQRCVEVNPENVHSWQAWAKLEHVAGNLTGARVLFERGIGANPRSVPCLQAYAHMERLSGCLESAKKLLLVALSLEPENPAVLMELALTEEAMGDWGKAEEYFRKAGIADRLKSRTKRKIFESRKAAPKVKVPLKTRIGATQETPSPVWRRRASPATQAGSWS